MASGVSRSMVLTLLGFCVSVLFIVFVCSRLVCALVHRRRRRSRPSPLPRFPPLPVSYFSAIQVDRQGHPSTGAGGLDPAVVAAFPTRSFSSGPRGSAFSDSADAAAQIGARCVICLAEYEDKVVLRVLPYCGHNFHVACIDIWLKQQSTCPVCRISLCDYPDSKHTVPPLQSPVILPPYSPEASRSDPCRCLFVSTGHSPRTSEVLRNEPNQANQIVRGPSVDRGNNLTFSEVNSPGENNHRMVK